MTTRASDQTRHGRSGSRIDGGGRSASQPTSRQRSRTPVVAVGSSVAEHGDGRSGPAALEIAHRFGFSEPFSIGVEEELFLVDPLTGRQMNSCATVLERLGEVQGKVEPELHACQIELITDIHGSARDAVAALGELRRAVLRTGTGLLASGTHPSAAEGDAAITATERYERVHYLLRDAAVTPVAGLHVHVGMPDPMTAIRTFNGLRRELPLLQALGANSPIRHGRDTGLASAREIALRQWPRSGVPRALRDHADFCDMSNALTQAAGVPDYTYCWWKLRPHPRLGTVEIRALDAQTSLSDTAALVALVHCLARDAAEREPGGDPPSELIEDGIFRAARFGVHGRLSDAHGNLRPVSEILRDTLARLQARARELGCVDELALLPDLLRRGGGAGVQRTIFRAAGLDGLTRQLTDLTAATAIARGESADAFGMTPRLNASAGLREARRGDLGERHVHSRPEATRLRCGP